MHTPLVPLPTGPGTRKPLGDSLPQPRRGAEPRPCTENSAPVTCSCPQSVPGQSGTAVRLREATGAERLCVIHRRCTGCPRSCPQARGSEAARARFLSSIPANTLETPLLGYQRQTDWTTMGLRGWRQRSAPGGVPLRADAMSVGSVGSRTAAGGSTRSERALVRPAARTDSNPPAAGRLFARVPRRRGGGDLAYVGHVIRRLGPDPPHPGRPVL